MSYEHIYEIVREILEEGRPKAAKRRPSYYKGLGDSTASKRAAQFGKQSKMSHDDPRAYKPAAGDSKETTPSKWTKKFKDMYGEGEEVNEMLGNPPGGNFTGEGAGVDESDFPYAAAMAAVAGKKTFKFGGKEYPVKMSKDRAENIVDEMEAVKREIEEMAAIVDEILNESGVIEERMSKKTRASLKKKAEKSRAPLGALTQVYDKGLAAWRTGHRPGAGQHQWAMARVNSFLAGGPARKVDSTQWEKVKKHRKKRKGRKKK
jgi:hypothetical protein